MTRLTLTRSGTIDGLFTAVPMLARKVAALTGHLTVGAIERKTRVLDVVETRGGAETREIMASLAGATILSSIELASMRILMAVLTLLVLFLEGEFAVRTPGLQQTFRGGDFF